MQALMPTWGHLLIDASVPLQHSLGSMEEDGQGYGCGVIDVECGHSYVCGSGQGDLCDGYARCRCVWRLAGCKPHPTSNPSPHSQRESKCTTYMYKYIPHHLSRSKGQTSCSGQDGDERYAEGERGQLRWEGAALGVDGKEEWRSYHQIIISSSINAHLNLVRVPSHPQMPYPLQLYYK